MIELIGYVGGLLFAFCCVPQLVHVVRTKDTSGLSWVFLGMWLGGEMLTLIYVNLKGTAHGPLVLNYVLNIVVLAILISYKHKNGD